MSFEAEFWIGYVVDIVLFLTALAAFVNALAWSGRFYQAADKLTKSGWLIILGLALLIEASSVFVVGFGFLLSLVAIVAPLVYFTDVRPAMKGLRRR